MEKGTNEYVDEEDGRLYKKPEPNPDEQRLDEFYRQEDEEQQKKEQQKKEEKGEAYVSEEEQDEVDDVDTFRQKLNQQGEEL